MVWSEQFPENENEDVFYSRQLLPASHLATEPLPTPRATAHPTATPTPEARPPELQGSPTATATSVVELPLGSSTGVNSEAGTTIPLVAALGSVGVMVILIIVIYAVLRNGITQYYLRKRAAGRK